MQAVHFQEQYFDAYVEMCGDEEITIRTVKEDLEDEALRIRLDCLRDVEGLPPRHRFEQDFVDRTWLFFRAAEQTTLLAMDGDIAIACATLCYKNCIPTLGHPTGMRAHLMNVYTAAGYRRQGIASRLIRELHDIARMRGVTEITLDATDKGRPLYTALGYKASDECMYFDMKR